MMIDSQSSQDWIIFDVWHACSGVTYEDIQKNLLVSTASLTEKAPAETPLSDLPIQVWARRHQVKDAWVIPSSKQFQVHLRSKRISGYFRDENGDGRNNYLSFRFIKLLTRSSANRKLTNMHVVPAAENQFRISIKRLI